MKTRMIVKMLLSIPKTLYVNLKLFGWKGFKCPILVSYDTKIAQPAYGSVSLGKPSFGCVAIGFTGTEGVPGTGGGYLEIRRGAKVEFEGKAKFGRGNSIRIGGHFAVGNGFSSNVNCFFSCNHEIIFGADCLLAWNVKIRDSDNHVILIDGRESNKDKSVVIGNHCWLCAYSDILKGVTIPDGSVVAYRACITRSIQEKNVLLGGIGGTVLKHNVEWTR